MVRAVPVFISWQRRRRAPPRSLDDVRRASVARADCIFIADTFFEANAQSLAKRVPPDASRSTKRHVCLEEVLDILSQD